MIFYFLFHLLFSFERMLHKSGDDSEKVTPVPIPNTEVKLLSADGSWGFSPCESRTSPSIKWRISSAGRASALQAEGRRFDPVILHHIFAGLAQLVEQLTCNQ